MSTFAGFPETLIKQHEETEISDEREEDSGDWYCIKTDPYQCPACHETVNFFTSLHRVVVFPEKDCDDILLYAKYLKGDNAEKKDRNPVIVLYEKSFGPAITMDQYRAQRFPAHYRPEDE